MRVKLFVGLPASLPSVKSQKLFDIHRPDGDCSVKSECWVCQPENGPMKNWAGRRALETLVRNVSANASTKCLSTRNPACEYFSCEKDIFLYRNILVDFHLDVSAESEKRIGTHVQCAKEVITTLAHSCAKISFSFPQEN